MKPLCALARGAILMVFGSYAVQAADSQLGHQYQQGLAAYLASDGLQAGELWEPCALAGHSGCEYGLGVLYDSGAPIWPRDTQKSLHWLKLAARQGHADAQIRLGFLYAIGREDLPQSIVDAYVWFARAVAAGHPQARAQRERVMQFMTEAEVELGARMLAEEGIIYQQLHDDARFPQAGPEKPSATR